MTEVPWKDFQDHVADLERELVPKGAVVASPDFIIDKRTKKKREVDASIRFTLGSAKILITVECRMRNQKQDVRWIEELAKKREAIGADKTIAVSSKGFSVAAMEVAEHEGIDLRILREVTADSILRLPSRLQMEEIEDEWAIKWFRFLVEDRGQLTGVDPVEETLNAFKTGDRTFVLAHDRETGEKFRISDLDRSAHTFLINEIRPKPGEEGQATVAVRPRSGRFEVQTTEGLVVLHSIEFGMTYRTTIRLLPRVSQLEYTDPESKEVLLGRVEFVTSESRIVRVQYTTGGRKDSGGG